MNRPSLDALMAPASIAVSGASNDPSRIGGRPLQQLPAHGFAGRVYGVNPRYTAADATVVARLPTLGRLSRCAPADLPAACRAIARFSALLMASDDALAEVEVNPLLVRPQGKGAVAAAALVVLAARNTLAQTIG